MTTWTRLVILVSLLAFFVTYATILRLPCLDHAVFSIIHENKALKGHVIAKHSGITDIQCTVKCVEHHKCRSYNININSGECHLNSKALADAGAELRTEAGWVYKSTDYNETMVGETCMALKPCPAGILCKDTCNSPFYECIFCDEKYTGLHCDIPIDGDECTENPCRNSGVCVDKYADYECNCPPGYSGKNCETDINECESLPCMNGGTCINLVNNFQCQCTAGYTGSNCATDFDDCFSKPCLNDGSCVDKLNGYICNCKSGTTGTLCETDIDECRSQPCMNFGTCKDKMNKFECQCLPAYTGETCQKKKTDPESLYVGCYIDAGDRALFGVGGMKQNDVIGITKQCIKICKGAGHPYAGLQWYSQCFCGTTYDKHGKASESACNTACRDSFGRMCGGSWKNSIYKTS